MSESKSVRRKKGLARLVMALDDAASPANVAKHVVRRFQGAEKARLLKATDGACEGCPVSLPDPDMLHLHHVIPVERGGTNTHRNVVLLCPNCHAIAHWYDRKLGDDERPTGRQELLARLRNGQGGLELLRRIG